MPAKKQISPTHRNKRPDAEETASSRDEAESESESGTEQQRGTDASQALVNAGTPVTPQTPATPQTPTVLPEQIKTVVAEFVKLDDEMRETKKELKAVRTEIERKRDLIIGFMVKNDVQRISVRKGTQYLECKKSMHKKRPTKKHMVAVLRQLINEGVTDADVILEAMMNAAGKEERTSLLRRSKRGAK